MSLFFLQRNVLLVVDSRRIPHPEYPPMSYTTLGLRTLLLVSLCLTLFVGNSARASLLPSEHPGGSSTSGDPVHSLQLPQFLLLDSFPSWNSGRDSVPGMAFDLLGCSTIVDLSVTENRETEGLALSHSGLSESLLQDEESPVKATCQASQLLESDTVVITKIKSPSRSVNSLGLNWRPGRRSDSSVTRVMNSAYGVLAVLALGAVGITVFRWNQRRLEIQKFRRFSSISDSELAMARLSAVRPSGSLNNRESRVAHPAHTNQPASQAK
jgi:hypothetical protein